MNKATEPYAWPTLHATGPLGDLGETSTDEADLPLAELANAIEVIGVDFPLTEGSH